MSQSPEALPNEAVDFKINPQSLENVRTVGYVDVKVHGWRGDWCLTPRCCSVVRWCDPKVQHLRQVAQDQLCYQPTLHRRGTVAHFHYMALSCVHDLCCVTSLLWKPPSPRSARSNCSLCAWRPCVRYGVMPHVRGGVSLCTTLYARYARQLTPKAKHAKVRAVWVAVGAWGGRVTASCASVLCSDGDLESAARRR